MGGSVERVGYPLDTWDGAYRREPYACCTLCRKVFCVQIDGRIRRHKERGEWCRPRAAEAWGR